MGAERFSSRWTGVDKDPGGTIDYLDTVTSTNEAQAYKRQVLSFLALQARKRTEGLNYRVLYGEQQWKS